MLYITDGGYVIKKISEKELEEILKLYSMGCSIPDISEKYNISQSLIQSHLVKHNLYIYKNRRWTKNDIDFLKENYANSAWDFILEKLSKWKKEEIISKASTLGLKREVYFWNDEDIFILEKAYEDKIPTKQIVRLLGDKFSEEAILTKASKLNLKMRDWWTEEEDALLRELYRKEDMSEICKIFPHRNRKAIVSHAKSLGLIYKKYWTDSEVDYLTKNYLKMSDKEIGIILNRKPRAIQTKRLALGLLRSVDDGVYYCLSEYIRKHNGEWKRQSMQKCNFQCVITGQKFDHIHHLYGMNKILNETLLSLGYSDKVDINLLSKDELQEILMRFYETQSKYPLGICLTKEIHKEFHDAYGYGDNTIEQFNEFISNKNYKIKNKMYNTLFYP